MLPPDRSRTGGSITHRGLNNRTRARYRSGRKKATRTDVFPAPERHGLFFGSDDGATYRSVGSITRKPRSSVAVVGAVPERKPTWQAEA